MQKDKKPNIPDRTFLKREEIIELIRPLIPNVSKYMSRDELVGILRRKKSLEEKTFNIREDQEGIWITVNWDRNFLIPTQVMWPKMRAFNQLIDVPQFYEGQAGKVVKVNSTEDGTLKATLSTRIPTGILSFWVGASAAKSIYMVHPTLILQL